MDGEQLDFGLSANDDGAGCLFDAASIRSEAVALIAEARQADADGPWDENTLRFKKLMFPHLVSWLPDEAERNQLCFEFATELERIERLLAA
jgi:hypothetical protein